MEPERRQVTVLFADMVGFTAFSERSGEEAAFTLMRSLSKLMDDAVTQQGGVVQSFTGDGIMAVFGAPVAFEDAPLRACRAALSIFDQLKAAAPELAAKHGLRPQLRIGLNTGLAVMGNVQGGAEAGVTALGDTVNLAARVQSLAEADSVLMSDATHRLVQGMVEASFAGEHSVKGKAEAQKVFRLDGLRDGATRFEAAMSRGLSTFVGREHELEVLERGLNEAHFELRVIDIEAEPGMGKSRLLHEFRQRIGKERAFVLSGSCSPDGQQTPFLPFIEVVRGSFRVSAGEAEKGVAQKLEMGLTSLGLHSARNRGLLLHLLGLKVPEGALAGLDGLLIGLRTRELLQQLLEARCKLSPVLMLIEDLHWADSASAELLGKIVDSESNLRLLLVNTHRPEYTPPWLGHPGVNALRLEPLPLGDIRRLVQGRLGAETLAEALARQVADKAEGNPLFAEEIVSFIIEREILHAKDGKLDFAPNVVAAALPASVQSILNARVDRLAPKDRALLQAASVIGRRFNPELLAVAVSEADIDDRLAAIQALDLVHPEGKSGDYAFKHALVRDALYQSLLTEHRQELHSKIAEEIERRSSNRLAEVAEVLAHHYSQTNHNAKAFLYLSMAGSKSLGVYSLDEAARSFTAALALLDNNPDCASDDQVAEFLVSYTLLLNMNLEARTTIALLARYLPRINRLGDDPRAVLIRHHYVIALYYNTRYQDAVAVQRETSTIADHLGDNKSKAYSLAGEIFASTAVSPRPLPEFEALKRETIKASSADTADVYIQSWTRWVIAWGELHRGRINEARAAALELMDVGRQLADPRSTGMGLAVLTWIALASGSYAEALDYSEQSLAVAVAPWERLSALSGKGCSLVLLGQAQEGEKLLQQHRSDSLSRGYLYSLVGSDLAIGVCRVLRGDIAEGIGWIRESILKLEKDGYAGAADWYRLNLAEIYLQIVAGHEKPQLLTVLKNLLIVLNVMVTASSRIRNLATRVLQNPFLDPAGFHIGRAQLILGLLYKLKKKQTLATHHLTEARRILSQFGQTPILARVNTALAELRQ